MNQLEVMDAERAEKKTDKKKSILKWVLFFLCIAIAAAAYAIWDGSDDFYTGQWTDDSTYANYSLGFSFTLPDGMRPMTDDEMLSMVQSGIDAYEGEAAPDTDAMLATYEFCVYDPTTLQQVILRVENVGSGLKADALLDAAEEQFVSMGFDSCERLPVRDIGGTAFEVLRVHMGGKALYTCVHIMGEYAVQISATSESLLDCFAKL